MGNANKFFETHELENDREELNKWKEENGLKTKLENLYLNYLDTKEYALYNFTDKEMLRKFYLYLKENL